MSILYVTASARCQAESVSRQVGEAFVRAVSARTSEPVTRLDLAVQPLPELNAAILAVWNGFTPQSQSPIDVTATDFYGPLTAQLFAHTKYVFAFPNYNLSVPPVLAQYVLGAMRAGKTFTCTAGGYSGLLRGKRAMLICSSGGMCSAVDSPAYCYGPGWLSGVLSMSGVHDVRTLMVEGHEENPSQAERILQCAIAKAQAAAGEF